MMLRSLQFNLILILGVVPFGTGCATRGPDGTKVKEPTTLRFHLEVNPDGTDRNGPVTVNRSAPFTVNVNRSSFLTEYNITEAAVVDDSLGGFFIKVRFNQQGTWLLEQYSTANKGKRVAIFGQFDDQARWLAAPIMDQRITNGILAFTPDASREESDRIVRGLNELGQQVRKDDR